MTVCIPDDAPPVLRTRAVWSELAARASTDYYDTLPGAEDALIERIRGAELDKDALEALERDVTMLKEGLDDFFAL